MREKNTSPGPKREGQSPGPVKIMERRTTLKRTAFPAINHSLKFKSGGMPPATVQMAGIMECWLNISGWRQFARTPGKKPRGAPGRTGWPPRGFSQLRHTPE